ncbi:uncharacterized protein TRUGW13939_08089 [Talaromyces rugulosus]|uniref:SUN domain-containing protein n=1 Tax=Talaromyces rugulosus TaxID=121627 RepID=A0A7H8R853_TALRU|nr:uncharacterized protein TRUGW13939_08089 [Talaromyces rugulosus]QKX60943.1 hypothetical protein TRUGW13939_08089 [Talaromyces rugulosus]
MVICIGIFPLSDRRTAACGRRSPSSFAHTYRFKDLIGLQYHVSMHEPRMIIAHILMWMLLASVFSLAYGVSTTTTDARAPVCAIRKFNNSPLELPICYLDGESNSRPDDIVAESSGTTVQNATSTAATPPVQTAAADSELDSESPLDTANFLSFEDWKKQNLAKIGQSADTVGSRQRQGGGNQERRTPQARAINNALDALGDDAEIDLDFGGFGTENNNNAENGQTESWGRKVEDSSRTSETDRTQNAGGDSAEGVSAMGRRKDAGTTCKERFNYASFDCAATVLKTNPECSGSSSVLIENKDSYMLNECRAKNKFLILELCDDILVDTIVLANYEFFSSIFHTFRVSVSDRYPAKSDKWEDLGVFEAKNTRAVQAFAVANPLIWARYVRIEFLTHYGNEFYCPLSLVRIHGTTMLEEYKNEGDNRAEEEMEEVSEPVDPAVVTEAEPSPVVSSHPENTTTVLTTPDEVFFNETSHRARNSLEEAVFNHFLAATCAATEYASMTASVTSTPTQSSSPAAATTTTTTSVKATDTTTTATPSEPTIPSEQVTGHAEHTNSSHVATPSSSTAQQQNTTQPESSASDSTTTATTSSAKETPSTFAEATKVTPSNPPSPNPTTQESFFKSVNKRLQMLESNSSLSLLYIEEQSQILRDAFSKVEKRQLTKLNSFLESLNATVIDEIRNLQDVYQSLRTIILDDFETQQREVSSTASQLAVLTDELVFQKRMTAISSILIILLFALILIPRGASGGAVGSMIDFQSMMAWSPRQPSSPKTPEVPSSTESATTTPSSESEEGTQRRRSMNRHVDSYAVPNGLPNGLPTGLSTESVPTTYAEKQARARALSQLSDTDSGDYSPPCSHDLLAEGGLLDDAAYETTPTLEPGLMPRLMMKRPPVQPERPVSSPPVLTRTAAAAAAGGAAAELAVVSDTESVTSTEPFPPFPQ